MLKLFRKMTSKLSLKQKIAIAVTVIMLFAVIAISSLNHSRYEEYFSGQINLQTGQLLEQLGINIDTYLAELLRLTLTPYFNDDIMRLLDSSPADDAAKLEKSRRIESFLGSVMTIPRTDILRVYIFTADGIYSSEKTAPNLPRGYDYTQESLYIDALNSDEPVFLPVRSEDLSGKGLTQIFSIAQKLRSISDNTQELGILRVDANFYGIESIISKVHLHSGEGLFIVDNAKNLIYSRSDLDVVSRDKLLAEAQASITSTRANINSTDYLLNTYSLSSTDWKLVAINNYDELNRYGTLARNTTIIVAVGFTLASVFLLFIALNRFLKPMHQVVTLMEQVEHGNMNVRYVGKSIDEMGYLGDSFNRMLNELERSITENTQLIREVYEAQYLEKAAQYDLLCSQIRPHFLYNALNTIGLLVKCGEDSNAVTAIEKLSVYLRGIISSDRNIPLCSELKIIDAYLTFQKIRYNEKLWYTIGVDGQFLDYELPAISLQPLVENAVIHGCEKVSAAVHIKISSICEKDSWILCVEDDAEGIAKAVLDELNYRIAHEENRRYESDENRLTLSVGLINVHKRIRLKYGDPYGLSVQSDSETGTRAMIRLPYIDRERGNYV